MDLFTAITERHSVRAYLPRPVAPDIIEQALDMANKAPSNCNVQPWRILIASGEKLEEIRNTLIELAQTGTPANPDFSAGNYAEIPRYRKRQVDCAVAMYRQLGVERGDNEGRTQAALRNYKMFDAPHSAFFCMHRKFGTTVAVDLGMAAQNFMLALTSLGVGSCAQGTLRYYPDAVRQAFGEPKETAVVFGVSFGYEDTEAPVNATDPGRADILENALLVENA